jgi:hypothetical protein
MRAWKKIVVGVLAVTIAGIGFGYYQFTHMKFEFDDSAITMFKTIALAAPAKLFVIQRQDPATEDLRNAPLLEAYRKNPKAVEMDAQLMETFVDSLAVAEKANSSGRRLPFLSDTIADAAIKHADPWGNPFCVSGDAETFVIMSGGKTDKKLACKQGVRTATLMDIPRKKLLKTDSGYLILVIDRKDFRSSQPE